MRVFWHQGGLQLQPESKRETELLAELTKNIRFEEPPETQDCIPGGQTELGSDRAFECIVGGQQRGPRRLSR